MIDSGTMRLATRSSRLALIQAEMVRQALRQLSPDLSVVLVEVVTTGDALVEAPLEGLGGVGFFTDALERALVQGRAEIAVHSLKDVPVELAPGFEIAAVLEREDPRDVLVSPHGGLADLPRGALIGTDSARRSAQLLLHRPDLRFRSVRGNVPTRLEKLDGGAYDGLVLAAAGLLRLGLWHRVGEALAVEICLPAPGQGAIGIEALTGSPAAALVRALDHPPTVAAVTAERAVLAGLGGGCQTPMGALATVEPGSLALDAVMVTEGRPQRARVEGSPDQALELGREAARRLGRAPV